MATFLSSQEVVDLPSKESVVGLADFPAPEYSLLDSVAAKLSRFVIETRAGT